MKSCYLFLYVILFSTIFFAQTRDDNPSTNGYPDLLSKVFKSVTDSVSEEWIARYNWEQDTSDIAKAMTIDDSGNVYITGMSLILETYTSNYDLATVKYNSAGQQQWVSRYDIGGHADDYVNAIAVDKAGNVYITGSATNQMTTFKYNSSGVQLWRVTYSYVGWGDEGIALVTDDSCNIYVTGQSYTTAGIPDYVTIKYDSSGTELWIKRYSGPATGIDYPVAIARDDSNYIYITGRSYGDMATIKYNSSGGEEWIARYQGPSYFNDEATALALDDSGNVFVAGMSYNPGSEQDYVTVKYNASGIQQWATQYNGAGNSYDRPISMVVDNSGYVYVTGYSYGANTTYDYATVKYNSYTGEEEWVNRYNGITNDVDKPTGIAIDEQGNIYVTGSSVTYATHSDYTTIKYSPDGEQLWFVQYVGNGTSGDYPVAIQTDKDGYVYVGGYGAGYGTGYDYITIKYTQYITSEINSGGNSGFTYNLSQNFPNPFNPATTISYQIPQNGLVTLKIYDILGKEVATLVNEQKNQGKYSANFDASRLASGVYIYQIRVNDYVSSKKMLLLK